MNPSRPVRFTRDPAALHPIAERLRREVDGDVLFDRASRGRYSTDASIYQIEPVGVVVPRTMDAALTALAIAAEAGVPILPRGAGTSQCGQTVGAALVIDASAHLNRVIEIDAEAKRAVVEPGTVLDTLNGALKRHGLWFPVDVSTAAQATLGGMTGNNSCGTRSLTYGYMVHRVAAIDAWLSDGTRGRFGPAAELADPAIRALSQRAIALWTREKDEIARRFPKVSRHVAGYNLDALSPEGLNLARLLVGSEGTLAWYERITLELADIPRHKALGVAHFPRFHDAMDAAQHIVKLGPCAVELVDRTMIGLSRGIPAFASTINRYVKGEPDAILLVEFAGDDEAAQAKGVERLAELMADLGHPDAVVPLLQAGQQRELWEVRKAGLNIMMSMKGDGKPVSFIEDCAVPLEHLADYTAELTQVFRKHGTEGTFYAHASVGCLHVRPVLNMKGDGAIRMRAIAEEAADLVRRYKGAYSGEHGDGIVRSEWIAPFFGERLTSALSEIKGWFDPKGLMNPGKIVNAPRQDDRSLFRYRPGYRAEAPASVLDWTAWGGMPGAIEMCNNNGHCRKFDAGTMCPSWRVTREERHLTRGRANTLRLALSGQLAGEGFTGEAVREAFELCVSCKGCKRECPTGVDMARLKIEHLAADREARGFSVRDRLVGHLPGYAPWASRLAPVANALSRLPGVPSALESLTGFDKRRPLPAFASRSWLASQPEAATAGGPAVVLFADTFNNWLEPGNLAAARRVIEATGHAVIPARSPDGRALCCGRTYLSAGMAAKARASAAHLVEALTPHIERGTPVVGLEPSCLFTLKDEFLGLFPGDSRVKSLAELATPFETFAANHLPGVDAARWSAGEAHEYLVHGHCHQKAFDTFGDTLAALRAVPGAKVSAIESGCCGMAGTFGHEHYDDSMAMAELSLLPAVRGAPPGAVVVAAGTSCRSQVAHGASREAVHPAVALAAALAGSA